MSEEEKKKESGEISRRKFLKDAGLVVGGAAIGSTVLLAACGGEETTKTVTQTQTKTVTTAAGEVTKTVTETVNKFVCPIDSMEFDSLAELQAHFEAEHADVAPAALNVISLTVNGEAYKAQVEPEDTMHSILRDKLGITSPKDMCTGYGACGSCSVIMDGRPVLSCMLLAIECDGAVIQTAEGLADASHPLIEAYIKHYTMQCGYCTPGFVVTAKALLDHNPNPTEQDIRDALGGNLCRCGTYPAHIRAIQEAAGKL